MIVGTELRTWLGDRERQRQAQTAAAAYANSWRTGPIQARFDAMIEGLAEPSAEAVTDAVRRLFDDRLWLDRLIDGLAAEMRDDPFFDPPFRYLNSDIHSGLLLFEHPLVMIAAGVTGAAQLAAKKNCVRTSVSIGFTGHVGVLKFIKGGATLSLWEAPRISGDFNAAEAGRCAFAGRREVDEGETLIVDGRHQSFVIEHASSNLLVLQATVQAGRAPISVEYDAHSLEYVGCSAADDRASRVQMLATLLRKMEHPEAFEAIAPFAEDEDFFLRWHAVRELLGIDARAALPRLARMAEADPHPDARRAARSVLEQVAVPVSGTAACRA